jgi:hypothetical protein
MLRTNNTIRVRAHAYQPLFLHSSDVIQRQATRVVDERRRPKPRPRALPFHFITLLCGAKLRFAAFHDVDAINTGPPM